MSAPLQHEAAEPRKREGTMKLLGIGLPEMSMLILPVIAIVVLTILGYVKFIGKNADRKSKGGRFFNFDHFYIEKILKALYLLAAVTVAVFAVFTPINAAMVASSVGYYGGNAFGAAAGAFFGGLVVGALIFFIGEFLCRVFYEFSMMFVRLVTDARAIRNTVAGAPGDDAQPFAPAAPSAAPHGYPIAHQAASAPFPSVAPVPGVVPAAPAAQPPHVSWDCSCGQKGNTGSFCGTCGSPRP